MSLANTPLGISLIHMRPSQGPVDQLRTRRRRRTPQRAVLAAPSLSRRERGRSGHLLGGLVGASEAARPPQSGHRAGRRAFANAFRWSGSTASWMSCRQVYSRLPPAPAPLPPPPTKAPPGHTPQGAPPPRQRTAPFGPGSTAPRSASGGRGGHIDFGKRCFWVALPAGVWSRATTEWI